jgi:hypothetical protein
MNCEVGDLAIVVRTHSGRHVGKIVRCIALRPAYEFLNGVADAWDVLPPLEHPSGNHVPVSDWMLRPIRDPGDEVLDQSFAWLPPVPTLERQS